jgi:methyltransferase (TIGR00027 family)
MLQDRASLTAQRVAQRRAAHQLREQPPIFRDPLALRILGPEFEAAVRDAVTQPDQGWSRGLRLFLSIRSRVAEDELARAVERGVRQYVVLGAGLDTFAYRNPYAGLRVFEVDHPATQELKREYLRRADIAIPPSLAFAPVDFSRETFVDGLVRAGYAASSPAFYSWLGVTQYLATDVSLDTLRRIATLSDRNAIVFDYSRPRSSLDAEHHAAFDALAERVAQAGEPFVGFFDSNELASALRHMGYRTIEDLGADELNARYLRARGDGLELRGKAGRVMSARRRAARAPGSGTLVRILGRLGHARRLFG